MSNDDVIKVNQGYKLIGAMREQRQQLCFVVGRQGNAITLLLVKGIAQATVQQFEREFAQIDTPDGVYNLFSGNRVRDLNEVAEVCDIIMRSNYES